MLGPEQVGRRVVVRIRLADAAPGRKYRDVTGELIEADATRLRVLPASGAVVTVDTADIVAAKPIPAKPTPFSEILELERRLAASWPAVESEPLGGWLLRCSSGFSRRSDSVLALVDPGGDVDTAIGSVERWYNEHGQRTLFSVCSGVGRRLDDELASRGWRAEAETAVLTKTVEAGDYHGEAVITHQLSGPLLEQLGRGKPEAAAVVLGSGPNRAYAEIWRDGALAARGRAALEGGIAAVSGIGTLPDFRRQGLGSEIMAALSAWAAEAGAASVALQVEANNPAAIAMYERLGFKERYRYHYRRR